MKNVEQMLKELEIATQEMIVVPNSWLPESFHDDIRGGRTLARLNQMCDETHGISKHVKLKELKQRNIERMKNQVAEKSCFNERGDFIDLDGELDWSENEKDELQLHKNRMALVGGMLNSGMITKEDLEDE